MRILLYILLQFVLLSGLRAQLVSMVPQQYPVHFIPAMAGSSERHRIIVGGSLGLINSAYKGSNVNASYDQLIPKIRCGVGLYYSGGRNYWNPIENHIRDSISRDFLEERFMRDEKISSFGFVVSPKINFTSFGKIVYTLSPALVFEHSNMNSTRIDQLEQKRYNQVSGSGEGVSERSFNRFIRQRPDVKSNSIGINLLFNAPSWYVSTGLTIRQFLIQESGDVNQVESNSMEIYQQDYVLEFTNTDMVPQLAAGITLPKRKSEASLILSGNVSGRFPSTHYFSGDSAEFISYTELNSKPEFYHGSLSGTVKYHNFLLGINAVGFKSQYNASLSAGIQNKQFRVMAAYNPSIGNMNGCAELVAQMKF